MDKITVVCHKDHDKGYEDFQGKCLLCEIERLENRDWVGLTVNEVLELLPSSKWKAEETLLFVQRIEDELKHKNLPEGGA